MAAHKRICHANIMEEVTRKTFNIDGSNSSSPGFGGNSTTISISVSDNFNKRKLNTDSLEIMKTESAGTAVYAASHIDTPECKKKKVTKEELQTGISMPTGNPKVSHQILDASPSCLPSVSNLVGQKDETNKKQVNEGKKILCKICGKQFKSPQSKSTHLKNVHGVNAKGNVVIKPVKNYVSCVFCNKNYFRAWNLQRHIDTIHLLDENKLYSCLKCEYKTYRKDIFQRHCEMHNKETNKFFSNEPKVKKFKCLHCDAKYTHESNLNTHKKKAHGIKNNKVTICRKCPICPFSSSMLMKTEIYKHFEEIHNFNMTWEYHEFNSLDEFQIWKEAIEKKTVTTYVKSSVMLNMRLSYQCNRCGSYKPQGRGLRRTKLQGTCKINAFCPSEIIMKQGKESIKVKYLAEHVGHKNQIEHTRLSLPDRKSIAVKLINKVPQKEILRSMRASFPLINASDISNIKARLRLQDGYKKNGSNVVSTEARIAEPDDYKKNGSNVVRTEARIAEPDDYKKNGSNVVSTEARIAEPDDYKKNGSNVVRTEARIAEPDDYKKNGSNVERTEARIAEPKHSKSTSVLVLNEMAPSNKAELDTEKKALFKEFRSMLTAWEMKLRSKEHLDLLKKRMTALNSMVDALSSTESKEMEGQPLVGTSSKTLQQRQFVFLKPVLLIKKPTNNSGQVIAVLPSSGASGSV